MPMTPLKDRFRDHPLLGPVDWILRGIGQVVFQNNPLSGAVILGGIFFNSWIYGIVCLLGTIIGTLTAMALGSLFLVLNLPGFLYTVLGVLVMAKVSASIGIILQPTGMPVFTSVFVFVTWLMLLAQAGFKTLVPVPPVEATWPEDNLTRHRATQNK